MRLHNDCRPVRRLWIADLVKCRPTFDKEWCRIMILRDGAWTMSGCFVVTPRHCRGTAWACGPRRHNDAGAAPFDGPASFAGVTYSEMLNRTRELVPTLAARAVECEKLRRLPDDSERDLHRTGLYAFFSMRLCLEAVDILMSVAAPAVSTSAAPCSVCSVTPMPPTRMSCSHSTSRAPCSVSTPSAWPGRHPCFDRPVCLAHGKVTWDCAFSGARIAASNKQKLGGKR